MKSFFAFALFFFVASVVNGQTITGSLGNGTVARGSTANGQVVFDIPSGLHVNSNRPVSEFAIPTAVTISANNGLRVTNIRYPRGRNKKFAFSDAAINIYEGRVRIPFMLSVPLGFRGKSVSLRAVVRYQACTNEVCYPPRTKSIRINARVK